MSATHGTPNQNTVPTPFRKTRQEFDGPQWVINSGSWGLHRDASQMAREPVTFLDGSKTEHVILLRGCGWILEPILLSQDGQLTSSGQATMLNGNENADLAPNIKSEYRYRRGDLPGVDYDPELPAQGMPCYIKEVTTGQDYGREDLQSDRLAFPGPANEGNVPFDRVLAGVKTYRAGQGFLFQFWVPSVGEPADTLYRFFFGGPSDITGRHFGTGEWCVSFKGNGEAELHERVFGWTLRHQFRWAESTVAAKGWASVYISPFDRSRIFFICSHGKGNENAQRRLGEERVAPRDQPYQTSLYYHSPLLAKYVYRESITGAGVIRVDARGDLAARFAVGASEYAIEGTVLDEPFAFPRTLPAESVFRVLLQQIIPAGSDADLNYTVHDADTGTPLDAGPNANEWLTVAGQKRYQVKFELQGNTATPYLRSYSVELDASVTEALEEEAPTVAVDVAPVSVNLLGPDQDVTHQSGEVEIHDFAAECTPLAVRGRVPYRLFTEYAADHSETCLFDGEISTEAETIYAADGRVYERYEGTLTGKWATVWEQRVIGTHQYGLDPVTGQPQRITTVIINLLRAAGVPAAQIDVPDLPLEFWPSRDGGQNPYLLQHGTVFLEVAQDLARDYLDGWLTWCRNSGTSGLWRLRLNPSNPSSNILWNFVTTPPVVLGDDAEPTASLVHVPAAYPLLTTFVTRVRTKRQAPEANAIRVIGLTQSPVQRPVEAYKHNPKSFSKDPEHPTADPTHPDYIHGGEVLEVFFDPSIQTQEHANFLCDRFFELLCHGRELKLVDAPLFFVVDHEDPHYRVPRPLQIGDGVTLDEAVGVVHTCNIAYKDDINQEQNLELVMVPEGA